MMPIPRKSCSFLCWQRYICLLYTSVIKQLFDIYPNTIECWLSTIKQEEKNCHLYEKCGFIRTGDEIVVKDVYKRQHMGMVLMD